MREGFLLTPPRSLAWSSAGRQWIDDVAVSVRVFDLADAGQLHDARLAWLEEHSRKGL